MSPCVLCAMFRQARPEIRDLLLVSVTKDPGGRPYLQVTLPLCPDHERLPVLVLRAEGQPSGTDLYDGDHPGFWEDERAAIEGQEDEEVPGG